MKHLVILGLGALLCVGMIQCSMAKNTTNTYNSDSITSIEVKTDNRSVELCKSSDDQIKVILNNKDDLTTNIENGKLIINAEKESSHIVNVESSDLKVEIPEKAFNQLSVSSEIGDINTSEISAQNIKIDSEEGEITLNNCGAKALTCDSQTGNIDVTLNEADSITMDAATEMGDISTEIFNSKDMTKTTTGGMKLHGIIGNGDIKINLTSDSGNITIDK